MGSFNSARRHKITVVQAWIHTIFVRVGRSGHTWVEMGGTVTNTLKEQMVTVRNTMGAARYEWIGISSGLLGVVFSHSLMYRLCMPVIVKGNRLNDYTVRHVHVAHLYLSSLATVLCWSTRPPTVPGPRKCTILEYSTEWARYGWSSVSSSLHAVDTDTAYSNLYYFSELCRLLAYLHLLVCN